MDPGPERDLRAEVPPREQSSALRPGALGAGCARREPVAVSDCGRAGARSPRPRTRIRCAWARLLRRGRPVAAPRGSCSERCRLSDRASRLSCFSPASPPGTPGTPGTRTSAGTQETVFRAFGFSPRQASGRSRAPGTADATRGTSRIPCRCRRPGLNSDNDCPLRQTLQRFACAAQVLKEKTPQNEGVGLGTGPWPWGALRLPPR